MIDPDLDLSPATLARQCKGNTKLLPRFVVHDDVAWPWHSKVRLDKKNRIHMRRTTFNRVVPKQVPVKAGLWIRADAQEYFIDLQPHHLQGGADQQKEQAGHLHSRAMVKADEAGRLPDEHDYKEPIAATERQQIDRGDLAKLEASGKRRGVRSTALLGHSDE